MDLKKSHARHPAAPCAYCGCGIFMLHGFDKFDRANYICLKCSQREGNKPERDTTGWTKPLALKRMYAHTEAPVKTDNVTLAVQRILGSNLQEAWKTRRGPDPPDLFATNGKNIIGIEVVRFFLAQHSFTIGKNALEFGIGQIYFVLVVEVKSKDLEFFVLTRDEMAAKCEGKHEPRKDNYSLSIPRTEEGWKKEGWKKYHNAWTHPDWGMLGNQ